MRYIAVTVIQWYVGFSKMAMWFSPKCSFFSTHTFDDQRLVKWNVSCWGPIWYRMRILSTSHVDVEIAYTWMTITNRNWVDSSDSRSPLFGLIVRHFSISKLLRNIVGLIQTQVSGTMQQALFGEIGMGFGSFFATRIWSSSPSKMGISWEYTTNESWLLQL